MADAPPPSDPTELEVDGNRLTLLPDGPEPARAVLGLIDGAKRRLRLLYYIYAADQSGKLVYEAMERALDRGVSGFPAGRRIRA